MKCKICGKSRKNSEMSKHHRIPQRYSRNSMYGRGVSKMCIYCHRILHNAEVQGFCVLPKPTEEKIIQEKDEKKTEYYDCHNCGKADCPNCKIDEVEE